MKEKDNDLGECIWVNAAEMLKTRGSMIAHGMMMDFVTVLWWPSKQPFVFDPETIANALNAQFPRREYTPQLIREREQELREFFIVLPDGRWAPHPRFFVVNDPYIEGAGN